MKEKSNFPKMHVSLYVSDISKTVDFYNAFFDKETDKETIEIENIANTNCFPNSIFR